MGVKCIAWALDTPLGGNEKVVLLILGNRARDEDGLCWPGQKEVARQAFVSEKTVQRLLQKLEDGGYLTRTERYRENGSRTSDLVRLTVPWNPLDNLSGGSADQQTPVSGEPQTPVSPPEPKVGNGLSLTGEGTRSKPVSYRGRRVDKVVVERAEGALAVFNEMTGRTLSTRTGDGSASAMLKQVIGTMLEWPDVSAEEWASAVRNTCENPPDWVDGKQLQVGHIFGGRAVQHALANTGCPSARPGLARNGSAVQRNEALVEGWLNGQS